MGDFIALEVLFDLHAVGAVVSSDDSMRHDQKLYLQIFLQNRRCKSTSYQNFYCYFCSCLISVRVKATKIVKIHRFPLQQYEILLEKQGQSIEISLLNEQFTQQPSFLRLGYDLHIKLYQKSILAVQTSLERMSEHIKIKLTAVGDGISNKPQLLNAFSNRPNEWSPTVFDNYAVTLQLDGKTINLALWDTAGAEEYNRLRPLAYPHSDIFLITFVLNDDSSWRNVTHRWVPELVQNVAKVPMIIVATNSETRKQTDSKSQPPSYYASEASKMDCLYMECSWRTADNISQLRYKASLSETSQKEEQRFLLAHLRGRPVKPKLIEWRFYYIDLMLRKQDQSPQKLTVIKESQEFNLSYESKLKAPCLPRGSPATSKTAAKANLYDQTFLERDTEEIVKEYHTNPFFRAKLNYSLQTHSKSKFTSLPAHPHQSDALLSTHRHSCKSRNELVDSKVAEIVERLKSEGHRA